MLLQLFHMVYSVYSVCRLGLLPDALLRRRPPGRPIRPVFLGPPWVTRFVEVSKSVMSGTWHGDDMAAGHGDNDDRFWGDPKTSDRAFEWFVLFFFFRW